MEHAKTNVDIIKQPSLPNSKMKDRLLPCMYLVSNITSISPHHLPSHVITHNPITTPATTTPTTAPTPCVTLAPPPPVLPTLAAATCNPNAVVTVALPFTVVVTTLVAVVFASHPDQLVHGASVLHGPAVQPGQSVGGHALPPHHLVQGPFSHAELVREPVAQGGGLVPKGPGPLGPGGSEFA